MSGLVTMTPSSASGLISTSPDVDAGDDVTQTSFVKVNDNGGVDFQNVVSLSLDGVFTSDFDNYFICLHYTSTTSPWHGLRLRRDPGGGLEDDRTNSYAYQDVHADGPVLLGQRFTASDYWKTSVGSPTATGQNIHLYGPHLPQPTAKKSVNVTGSAAGVAGSASIYDYAGTHSLGNSYSGITIYPSRETFTGNLFVMGYAE